jgi:hypothetical protein
VQSNGALALDVLRECTRVVEGKYIVMPTFDGISTLPEPNQQNLSWHDIGAPRIIAGANDIPWTGNGEEIYVFSEKPGDGIFESIETPDTAMAERIDDTTEPFWSLLLRTSPESYIAQGAYFFFATIHAKQFKQVMESKTFQQLSERREQELQNLAAQVLQELGPEIGPEKCFNASCFRLRIELGIFCSTHHLAMLRQTADPTDN